MASVAAVDILFALIWALFIVEYENGTEKQILSHISTIDNEQKNGQVTREY